MWKRLELDNKKLNLINISCQCFSTNDQSSMTFSKIICNCKYFSVCGLRYSIYSNYKFPEPLSPYIYIYIYMSRVIIYIYSKK